MIIMVCIQLIGWDIFIINSTQILLAIWSQDVILKFLIIMSTPPPVGWGSTYCFTDVRVGVGISVVPITKGTPAQIFFGRLVFCSPGHWLLILP